MAQTPHFDGSIAGTRYQHVIVRLNLDSGALGHEHAVDISEVGKVADRAGVHLEDGLGLGDEAPAVIVAPGRAGAAGRLGVEEAVVPAVRMLLRVGRDAGAGVLEAGPLDGGVLGAKVQRLVLRAVGGAEDVADVVGAVDLVQAGQGSRVPDIDDGVAGAGEEQRGVGRERQRQNAALVGLDAVDLVECIQGPGHNLAVLGARVDGFVLWAHGEGQHGAGMVEAVDEIGEGR